MGWCSGTDVFDDVLSVIIHNPNIPIYTKVSLIKNLAQALEKHDWDCQSDSKYYDNKIVQNVFRTLHPHWCEDDDLDTDDLSK